MRRRLPDGGRLQLSALPVGYQAPTAPAGLHVPNQAWRILSVGPIFSRFTGEQLAEITADDLDGIAAYFDATRNEVSVPIDFDHDPDREHFGQVLDVFVADLGDDLGPGLFAVPALTADGVAAVAAFNGGEGGDGYLYTSPSIAWGPLYSKTTGERLGDVMIDGLALTARPKQATGRISAAQLGERAALNEGGGQPQEHTMNEEEMQARIAELEQQLEEANAKIAELEGDGREGDETDAAEAKAEAAKANEALAASEGKRREAEHKNLALAEQVAQLTARVQAGEKRQAATDAKLAETERDKVLDEMILTGKIAAAERTAAGQAYDGREQMPAVWKMFSDRKARAAVPVNTVRSVGIDSPQIIDLAERRQQLADKAREIYDGAAKDGKPISMEQATDLAEAELKKARSA